MIALNGVYYDGKDTVYYINLLISVKEFNRARLINSKWNELLSQVDLPRYMSDDGQYIYCHYRLEERSYPDMLPYMDSNQTIDGFVSSCATTETDEDIIVHNELINFLAKSSTNQRLTVCSNRLEMFLESLNYV